VSEHRVAIGALDLDSGERIEDVAQVVTLSGTVRDGGANCILVPHALTGDAHPETWWAGVVGHGGLIDPGEFCVVGVNVLGGCYGSTGPGSLAPDGRPYGSRFPLITVGDMVRAQRRALATLGIDRLHAIVGGSLGGMQALQWFFDAPELLRHVVVIGAYDHFSASGIAMNAVASGAIRLDRDFRGGEYDAATSPRQGLRLARKVAMISYKSDALFTERFARRPNRNGEDPYASFGARFDIEGYLDEQADRLADRFDANTYLVLSRAMDLFDTRHRAVPSPAPSLTFVGISSDALFLPHYVRATAARFAAAGVDTAYVELASDHGHDAFLAEPETLARLVGPRLKAQSPPRIETAGATTPLSMSEILTRG
jgi:homoserine O-acetyltransferase